MPTFLEVKQRVLSHFVRRDGKVARLPVPLTTTATAADTTSVRDTKLARGTHNANNYDGRHVEIVENVGAGPAVGEIAAVDDGGFDLTDKLTVSPAFSAALESGADYLLYPQGLAPEPVEQAINDVLQATEAPHIWAPSLVDDSDMGEDALTNWAAIGTPSTREFVTTAANIVFGDRSLHIVSDAADEGASTNSLYVVDTETMLVSVLAQVISGSLQVIMRRVTATAADVKTVTVDEPAFTEVRFQESVSGGMDEMTLRFLGVASGAEFYVSPHVIVQSDRRRAYVLPSWLTSESQILDLVTLPLGASAEAADSYISLSSQMRALVGLGFLRSDRDVNPFRLTFRNATGRPVYLLCRRPFAALSNLTDTTACDLEYVAAKAVSNILRDRDDREWRSWARKAARRAAEMGYGGRDMRSEQPTVMV